MKKTTLSLLLMLLSIVSYSQIAIIEDFEGGVPGDWTSTFFGSGTESCSGQSIRDNIYQFSSTGELVSPNIIGLSNGTDLNISFDYKIVDWSAATNPTPVGWGNFIVQYSTDGGTNWIDIGTVDDSNHVVSNECATLNYTVAAADLPMGSDYQMRFNATWAAGDYYLYFDNVSAVQVADMAPACDSVLTSPADGSIDNEINGDISWSVATGIPTGYFLTVGTTPGGNDLVDNLDVGNVTSYALGQLAYETTYYVTITPYNGIGTTTDPCTEQSFTTKMDPSQTVDCAGAPLNITYCYDNNDTTFWLFTSSDGSPLRITFNAGGIESCCDDILIYDGVDNTGTLIYQGNNGGDLAGLQFDSVGPSLYVEIDSDFSVSCASGSGCCGTEWDFTVACATCVNPVATSSVREDCENGPQFFVDVDLTDLGSATSVTIADDQGSTPQTVSATGVYSFGPFANGTNVVTTVTNDDDSNCVVTSPSLTQDQCVLNLIDCTQAPTQFNYCYDNNDDTTWLFRSTDGSPLRITFNAGGIESCCDDILIYDGPDNTAPLLFQGNNGGDLSGLTFDSTGDEMFMEIDADGSVSCASGSFCCTTEWDFTVACATCVNPSATYNVVSDCVNGPQFLVDVDLTDLGSATSVTISDDQGSTPQVVSTTGVYTFGPFPNTTDVVITIANDDDANCTVSSNPVTQPFCLDTVVDCSAGPVSVSYCYFNNDTNVFQYTSSDGSPLNLTIDSGIIEGDPFDFLVILDSDGVTELYNDEGNNGDIGGLTFQSTGDTIFFSVQSDGSVSCESGSAGEVDGIDYTVACATCINPQATYVVIDDCENGDQFLVDVNITSLGDATSVTITDNQGSTPVSVSATGITQFGPYPFNTDIVITVSNDQDVNCVINSQPIQLLACPPDNDNCPDAIVAGVNPDNTCTITTPGTLIEATDSGIPGGSCTGNPDDDVWYQFTALEEIQLIILQNIQGGGFFNDLDHAVYEGADCDNLTELYCSEQDASIAENLTIGNTYYIRVFSAGGDPVDTTFDLCIQPGSGNISTDQTTYTVEELVTEVLIGGECAEIFNITWSTGTDFGDVNGIAYFSRDGDDGFPFEEGILMTNGDASLADGPNINAMSTGGFGWPGDPDLDNIVDPGGGSIDSGNATIIEFDFIPLAQNISFDFLMASEEYNGATGGTFECTFSDVFAFFLTDPDGNTTNLAVLPGTTEPILVTNIHPENPGCPAINEEFFGGYTPQNLPPMSFDGRTVVFTAQSPVTIGETYHIKLAIADDADTALDSGVFLKAGSFDLGQLDLGDDITIASGGAGCLGEPITLDTQAPNLEHVWFLDGIAIAGEAASTLEVTEPGNYTAQVIFSSQCIIEDSIVVEFFDLPEANMPSDLEACSVTGFAEFMLTNSDAEVLGSQNPSDFTVTYHLSQQEADDGVGAQASPYTNIGNPQIIYVRVEDNATGCFATTTFNLVVNLPTHTATSVPLIACDNDQDGIADFDLPSHNVEVLNGQDASLYTITYHASQADADANTGALPNSYSSSAGTIFVRVEVSGTPDCYVTTSIDLVIGTFPLTTFNSDIDYEVCPNATVPIDVVATAENYALSDVTVVWFKDGDVIPEETGLTLPVLEGGVYSIEVTFNDTGCFNTTDVTVIELPFCEFPQGISPGEVDGLNDRFDLSNFDVVRLEIFNRNGTLVYSRDNYTDEWVGQDKNGNDLPVGTYFYSVVYEGGAKRKTAWVYINR